MSSIHVSSQAQTNWKIEKGETGIEVHITIGDDLYRIKSMTVDGQLIDLSNPALESYATRVAELATKTLLAMQKDIPDRRKFKVSLAKSETSSKTKVIHDRDEKFSTELDEPNLLHDIEKRARIILHGKAFTDSLQEVKKKKELSKRAKMATRVGAGMLAVVTAPVVVPFVGLTKLAHAIKSRSKGPVRTATEKLQLEEARNRNNALRQALVSKEGRGPKIIKRKFPRSDTRFSNEILSKKLTSKLSNKLDRFIDRNDSYKIMDFKQKIENNSKSKHFENPEKLRKFLTKQAKGTPVEELIYAFVADEDLLQLIHESKLLVAESASKKEILKEDKKRWNKFVEAVIDSPSDSKVVKQNNKVLKAFREVLQSDTYQALKNDPHNEFVQLVQGFALAMYGGVSVIDSCREFGAALDRGDNSDPLHQQLKTAHESAKSENMNTDGLTNFVYRATHIDKTLNSLASQGEVAAEVAKMFGSEGYDPHLFGNTPSHQGIQTTRVGGREAKVEISYAGSPFVGDEIAPEFLAVLDLIRNNNSARTFQQSSIPSAMVYTNLQKFTGSEGKRSRKLMALGEDYQDVFFPHTQTKDGPFYDGKGKYEMKEWTSAEDFGKTLLHEMEKDVCYQYLGRGGEDDPGIYLPFSKEQGKVMLPKIIEKANQHFARLAATEDPELIKKYRYAYQEYVYFMVQSYLENAVARHRSSVMAIRACRENKDRGAAHNLKDLFVNYQGTPEDKVVLLAALQNYRALAAGDTTILEDRIKPIWAFFEYVNPEECRQEVAAFLADEFKSDIGPTSFEPSTRQQAIPQGRLRENKKGNRGVTLEFERVLTTPHQGNPPVDNDSGEEEGVDSGEDSDHDPFLR